MPIPGINPIMMLGPLASLSMSYATYAYSSNQTITMPSDIQSGDLAIMVDSAVSLSGGLSTATAVTPDGFTNFLNRADSGIGDSRRARVMFSAKILSGTEGGASLTGMFENGQMRKYIGVFRPNKTIALGSAFEGSMSAGGGNLGAKTITGATASVPAVTLAMRHCNNSGAFTYPAGADIQFQVSGYNFSVAMMAMEDLIESTTWDTGDDGAWNILTACGLQLSIS